MMSSEIIIGESITKEVEKEGPAPLELFDLSGYEKKIFAIGNSMMSPTPKQLFLSSTVQIGEVVHPSFVCIGVISASGNIVGPLALELTQKHGYTIEDLTSSY